MSVIEQTSVEISFISKEGQLYVSTLVNSDSRNFTLKKRDLGFSGKLG